MRCVINAENHARNQLLSTLPTSSFIKKPTSSTSSPTATTTDDKERSTANATSVTDGGGGGGGGGGGVPDPDEALVYRVYRFNCGRSQIEFEIATKGAMLIIYIIAYLMNSA